MAIVVYKCDACKREIELIRNIEGLETVSRCVITLGCRGRLYQTKVHPDFIRASIPDDVLGLDNWIPRKVLHNHTQTIESSEWRITHEMGTYPSISVYVDRPTSEDPNARVEILPTDVVIVDSDQLILKFDRPQSGIAQLVARASDPQLLQPTIKPTQEAIPNVQISANGYITIATRVDKFGTDPIINLKLKYTSNTGNASLISYPTILTVAEGTPWSDATRVLFKGKVYLVRQFYGIVPEITTGSIVNGTQFRFYSFDMNNDRVDDYVVDPLDQTGSPPLPGVLQPNDVIILGASAPFGVVDKAASSYIDVTSIKASTPQGLFYNNGQFFASPSTVQTVYPLIRVV